MSRQYVCPIPTCAREYDSPIPVQALTCSGRNGRTHTPRAMKPVNPQGDAEMAENTDTKKTKTKAPERECQCYAEPVEGEEFKFQSCGRMTRNEFAPGHDAKLKSALIKCAVGGSKITQVVDGKNRVNDPAKLASERNWDRFIERAVEVAEEKAAKKAEKEKAKAEAKAEREAEKAEKAKAKKEAAKKAPAKKKAAAKPKKAAAPKKKAAATKSVSLDENLVDNIS